LLIVSASRRTDLIAFYPKYFSNILKKRKVKVQGPFGHRYSVNLSPSGVHTIVLWSKNFENFINNRFELKDLLMSYSQIYLHFTITGLGGAEMEPIIPKPQKALEQLKELVKIVGTERIAIRFDPIIFYKYEGKLKTNYDFFPILIKEISKHGLKKLIFSFVQYYPTVIKRFKKVGIEYIDPSKEKKLKLASDMAKEIRETDIKLYACSQEFLTKIEGIEKSKCIDAEYLSNIHPLGWKIKYKKDRGQRKECGCSESKDIGNYGMSCPIPCLYCYANKKINVRIK